MQIQVRGGWKCPYCSSNFLVETMVGVSIKTRVDGLDGDGHLILGPQQDSAGGEPSGYACGQCARAVTHNGKVIKDRKSMAKVLAG